MTTDTMPAAARISAIIGSSASDDGTLLKIGVKGENDATVNLIMTPQRAIDLIVAAASALGAAKQNNTTDPAIRYVLPAERWAAEPVIDDKLLRLCFFLPGGGEVCFQLEKENAIHMHEALGVILGMTKPDTVPKGRVN